MNEKTERISAYVSADLIEKIKATGRSIEDVANEALALYFDKIKGISNE